MQLAEIGQPANISLYTGSAILQNIGLSPLMLSTIGLLSRFLDSVHRNHRTILHRYFFHGIHLIIIIGLILGIVGGTNAADSYVASGFTTYSPGALSKAGTAVFIVAYVLIVASAIILWFSASYGAQSERKLFYAVILALPFILVRLVYSSLSTFSHNKNFNLLEGSISVLVCVALLEEFVVVVAYITVGLIVNPVPKEQRAAPAATNPNGTSAHATAAEPEKKENIFLKIAKMTIIGHIVMMLIPKNKGPDARKDTEMQRINS
jgi:hypothetical protein